MQLFLILEFLGPMHSVPRHLVFPWWSKLEILPFLPPAPNTVLPPKAAVLSGAQGEQSCSRLICPSACGISAGKESDCNAGDPGSFPGSGSSPGEGISYPLQYFGASLVSQMVKNLPAMWETWVQSLGWEDPLEEGMATHSSILAWRSPMNRWAGVHGVAESDTTE